MEGYDEVDGVRMCHPSVTHFGEKKMLKDDNLNGDQCKGDLSVFTVTDINLAQGTQNEPAWIVITCNDQTQSAVITQIEVESNARFVEVYLADKYVVRARMTT